MTAAVLDASGTLLVHILDEPGSDKGRRVLTGHTTTAVGKVLGHFAHLGSTETDIRAMLDPLPFVRVVLDEELAFITGLMSPATRSAGLSFGSSAMPDAHQRA